MNIQEMSYLIDNNISNRDWLTVLRLVDNSLHGILIKDYRDIAFDRGNYNRLIKKLKACDLLKVVQGQLRLNPYFYLHNAVSKHLAKKLQRAWDSSCLYSGAKTIVCPVDNTVFVYNGDGYNMSYAVAV